MDDITRKMVNTTLYIPVLHTHNIRKEKSGFEGWYHRLPTPLP